MKLSPYVTGLVLVLFSTIILSTAGLMARMVSLAARRSSSGGGWQVGRRSF